MNKKILNKIFLVIAGLLLALIMLEISMWLAGFAITSYKKHTNDRALKNKSQYTIMCLGESTTSQKYPIQLQNILNKKYPEKFSVIDCGIEAARLGTILDLLDSNIAKYHPDIAICMMGVNNGFYQYQDDTKINQTKLNSLKNKIKVYKLYLLLKEHIKALLNPQELFADKLDLENDTAEILKQVTNLLDRQATNPAEKAEFYKAEKLLNNILKIDPLNEVAYSHLINIYTDFLNHKDIAYKMAAEGLNISSFSKREYYYTIIINYNIQYKNIEDAALLFSKMISEDNMVIRPDLYKNIEHFLSPELKEAAIQKMVKTKIETDRSCGLIAKVYMEQKDYNKATQYFNMAEELRTKFPNEQTNKLYRLIIKKLIDNNIKVICMQYPVRSIKSLQNILKDTDYYDKVTFISNEENFKQVLKEKSYNALFVDQFAGEFGHCTDYGNTLIAENVVQNLVKSIE